ncbi:MAG: GH39 family glycosyl hydrolase [Pyrinomonadaceae bacterium]
MSVTFNCDLSGAATPFKHFWEHTVGSGHATLALRADWQAQLKKSRDELGFRHVRFHGILDDDMGTLICQNEKFLYSFFNTDQIFDFLLSIGMRPFVELGFMPATLSSGNKTVFHYRGNVTPPKDYKNWATLIKKIVSHWVERYGVEEVREWFFEIWNEPNLKAFWTGKKADYFKLYKYTAEAIKKVDKSLKVGGPATAKNAWISDFVEYCEKHKLPADFVSTHHYPTDAFGKISDNTIGQLAASRRSIMREDAQNVFRHAKGKPVYYTEWNSSSNPRDALHDEPYAAAFVVKTILEAKGLVEGYSFWTFSDIFEENYFPSVPFQGGFGLLNIYGIPKPTYRAFELLHHLGDEQLLVDGLHKTVDAWAVRKKNSVTVLLTNHALPRHQIETEKVRVNLNNAPEKCSAFAERIDEHHANAKKIWQEMDKPEYLSAKQVENLQGASRLIREPVACQSKDKTASFEIEMLPHSVAAVTLELNAETRTK